MKRVWFFVEGNDDESFISRFLRKIQFPFEYEVIKYRQLEKGKVDRYLNSIKERGDNYFFLSDFDKGPCIEKRKNELLETYSKLEKERIIIVKREIESWYLALINDEFAKEISIDPNILRDTSLCTRSLFDEIRKKAHYNDIEFKQEILINFKSSDIDLSRQRNSSLDYFIKKLEQLK